MKQSERILKLSQTDANDSDENDDGLIITIEMQSVIPFLCKLKSWLGFSLSDLRAAIVTNMDPVLTGYITG